MIAPPSYVSSVYSAFAARNIDSSNISNNNVSEAHFPSRSYDSVELSSQGQLKEISSSIILPTMENVRELSAEVETMLGNIFRENGISNDPPVALSMNFDGVITVENGHPDSERIEDVLNADSEFTYLYHTLEAISSHARAIQESLQFQAEYRASGGSPYVIAKYSHLFGKQPPQTITMQYGSSGLDIMFNGGVWNTGESAAISL